jgi:hypothetical protein
MPQTETAMFQAALQLCSTFVVSLRGTLTEVSFGSGNPRIHLSLKIDQRLLTDLEKSL